MNFSSSLFLDMKEYCNDGFMIAPILKWIIICLSMYVIGNRNKNSDSKQ